MAKYLKPQTPLQHQNGDYIYPLTTVDQVIIDKDNRLNSLFKKTIKEIATLQVAGWSDTKPYTQTIILNHSVDDYDVDANVAYGDEDNAALHAAAGCLSYIKKNNNTITFYCLKKKPDIDLPVELTGTCRNTIATIEEGVKLNFDIVAYATEEEMLADTPAENTIGVITDVEITGYKFSATEPENIVEGEVWIKIGTESDVAFDIANDVTIYPLSAKQYVSGAWIDKTAKSYQNNVWIEWVIYLLNGENTCDSITGGWEVRNHTSYANIGSVIFNNNGVTLSIPSSSTSYAVSVMTKNKISLSNIKTISVKAENVVTDYPYNLSIYFSTEPLTNVNKTGNQAASLQFIEGENTFEIPEGLVNGEYYISIGYHSYAVGTQSVTINNVFLR